MSAEAEVSEALQTLVDQNTQAVEDTKRMLAELQGDSAPTAGGAETNGKAGSDDAEKPEVTELSKNGDPVKVEDEGEAERTAEETSQRESSRGGRDAGKGKSNQGRRNYRENIKSDLTTQDPSSDPVAIRKQVEFYFSDSNLPNDKFLLLKVGGSQNNPVELTVLHTFKRMRHFQPFEAIVEALRESKILELTDNDTCVRRKEPLPESLNNGPDRGAVKVFEDRAMPRSVYAKGFGEEVPSTQFDIEAFFLPYGPTNAVRLRRTDEKVFKGSVFVEFETEELAKAFVALDPKPTYKGKELQVMSKKAYCDQKVEDIKSGKIKPNNRGEFRKRDGRGGRNRNFDRNAEDTRDWRTRRNEDRKHGFRDDKKHGNWDRGSPRSARGARSHVTGKDERGIPTVKASGDRSKPKHDSGRDEALARAKAAVEVESKKDEQESSQGGEVPNERPDTCDPTNAKGTKRARDDHDEASDAGHEAKKLDSKQEPLQVNGS